MPITQEELEKRRAQIAALEARIAAGGGGENDNEIAPPAVITPEQARLNARREAFRITPLTPKQKALNEELDRAKAVSGSEAHYRANNPTFSSTSAIGGLLSKGLNKFVLGRDKKLAASEEILYQGLQKSREAQQLEALRKNQQSIKQADFTANVGLDAVDLADERSVLAATVADDRSVDAATDLENLKNTNEIGRDVVKYELEEYGLGAKSAAKHLRNASALQRFLRAEEGTPEGGVQPFIHGIKNMLVSFGIPAGNLPQIDTMHQAVNAILASEMTERGARGLTDKDMIILRTASIQPNISSESRREIAEIMLRVARDGVYDQIGRYDQMTERGVGVSAPVWLDAHRPGYERRKAKEKEIAELEAAILRKIEEEAAGR